MNFEKEEYDMTEVGMGNPVALGGGDSPAGELERYANSLQIQVDELHNVRSRLENLADKLWGDEPIAEGKAGVEALPRGGQVGQVEILIRNCNGTIDHIKNAVNRLEQLT